jgi:hypothetical protein
MGPSLRPQPLFAQTHPGENERQAEEEEEEEEGYETAR